MDRAGRNFACIPPICCCVGGRSQSVPTVPGTPHLKTFRTALIYAAMMRCDVSYCIPNAERTRRYQTKKEKISQEKRIQNTKQKS